MASTPDRIKAQYPEAFEVTLQTEQTSIYVLVDPRSPEFVAYVGRAVNPHLRLYQHLIRKRREEHFAKSVWINDLKHLGLVPRMFVIDVVNVADATEAEREAIKRFKSLGQAILNNDRMSNDAEYKSSKRNGRKRKDQNFNLG